MGVAFQIAEELEVGVDGRGVLELGLECLDDTLPLDLIHKQIRQHHGQAAPQINVWSRAQAQVVESGGVGRHLHGEDRLAGLEADGRHRGLVADLANWRFGHRIQPAERLFGCQGVHGLRDLVNQRTLVACAQSSGHEHTRRRGGI